MRMVDPRQPRFGQAVTGLALAIAFVLELRAAIPALAVVLAGASLLGAPGNLYAWAFRALRPMLNPPAELEDAAPPRFANTLGFLFLAAASVFLLSGVPALAWGLALLVSGLALLAAATGLCVGCELYVIARRALARDRRRAATPRA